MKNTQTNVSVVPESHQAPKDGIENLNGDRVARNDRKSPLVNPVVERPVDIEAKRLPHHRGVTAAAQIPHRATRRQKLVTHLLSASQGQLATHRSLAMLLQA